MAFADAIVLGHGIETAGKMVGVGRSRAFELARDEQVEAMVATGREEVRRRILDSVTTGALTGVATLIEIAADPTCAPTPRVMAARSLLDIAGEQIELHEIRTQVRDLKALIEPTGPQTALDRARAEIDRVTT